MRGSLRPWLAALGVVVAACGSSSSAGAPAPQGPGFFITISGMSFAPLDLHVPPGGTVTVINQDAMAHSVTSEATPSAFAHAAVNGVSFDTGQFTGTRTFTVPGAAPSGTVVPYFCTAHLGTMTTPNGAITIDPAAVATAAPGSGGGGAGGGGGGY